MLSSVDRNCQIINLLKLLSTFDRNCQKHVHPRQAQSDDSAQSPQQNEETYNPPNRLSKKVFDLAKDPSGITLPAKLRPRDNVADHDKIECQLDADGLEDLDQSRVRGNFILNLNLVEKHFNERVNIHRQRNPQCNGLIVSNPNNSQKVGWAYASTLHCLKCGFETQKLTQHQQSAVNVCHSPNGRISCLKGK